MTTRKVAQVRMVASSLLLLLALTITPLLVGGKSLAATRDGLKAEDVRPLLESLPYKIKLWEVPPPKHDTAAFRGRATGPRHAVLRFTVGLGPFAVPLPGIGTKHAIGNPDFAFNSTASVPGDFPAAAQWREAVDMDVAMEEKLCRAATGQACPD